MSSRKNIYLYKLTSDDGAAPCVRDDLLSLAICKPMIRRKVKEGDVIFGFAANSLHRERDNRLVYVAVITKKLNGQQYYGDRRFRGRADCIYTSRGGQFQRGRGALYHHGPGDITHDLGESPWHERAYVLLSNDFRYFGREGNTQYKEQYPLIKNSVEHLGQGHRVHHQPDLRAELCAFKALVWDSTRQDQVGMQTSPPPKPRIRQPLPIMRVVTKKL